MLTIQDYFDMYVSCIVTAEPTRVLDTRVICRDIMNNQVTYWGVEKALGIPWLVVAALHYRESNLSFNCHLHNGDPLSARTVHVPSGRPCDGEPPFTWTASAIDALSLRHHPNDWNVGSALQFCEGYNGFGYQKRGIASPYLWSFTDIYECGLFVADGSFDPVKKDARPGVAALFKSFESLGVSLELGGAMATPSNTIH